MSRRKTSPSPAHPTAPNLAPPRPAPRRRDLLAVALLLLITLPWWVAVTCPFLQIDDANYIWKNPMVGNGLSGADFRWAFTTTTGGFWMPLTWLSLQLDATLFGPPPAPPALAAGFHLTNIVLHIACVMLVYFVLRTATGAPWRSLIVAALFAIHPLRVESVAWAIERKDVLSACLGLAALLAYVRFARRPRTMTYLLMLAAYAASLMTKSMLVTLPFVMLLLDFWPLERWTGGGGPHQVPPRRLLLEKVPLLVLSAATCIITYAVQAHLHDLMDTARNPLLHRLQNAVIAYAMYLRDMVYFGDLSIYYPLQPTLPAGLAALSLTLLVVITGAALWMTRRRPESGKPLLVGWLWFLGTLVPVIGLVQSGAQSRADRFTYFPSIGLALALTWVWPAAWFAGAAVLRWTRLAVGGLIFALGVYMTLRLWMWRDPLALYLDGIAHTPGDHFFLNFTVAAEFQQEDNAPGAIDYYLRAIQASPGFAPAHNNLGEVLAALGRRDAALLEFRRAAELAPDDQHLQDRYREALAAQSRSATTTAPH